MLLEKSWFKNKKITVMGLGTHGGALGNARWLAKQGAKITLTDLKSEKELFSQVKQLSNTKNIRLVLGKHEEKDFTNADMVLRNPAVPRNSKYLQIAKNANVPVEMDSSLFFKLVGRENIIGVTGSKGKTTTTQTIAKILDIKSVGTEGSSPLELINPENKNEKYVFELSSWRLEALEEQKISPAIAVLTSIYRDHLNTYDSYEEYKNIKKTIFQYQQEKDMILINRDNEELISWKKEINAKAYFFSLNKIEQKGIFIRQKNIIIRLNEKEREVATLNDIPLSHPQEIRNTLPAIFLAHYKNIDTEEIQSRLSQLKPLPHRMEEVPCHLPYKFINDSASTMPDAATAAIDALSPRPIIHILGGNDKELDFNNWAQKEAKANIKHLIWLPGTATKTMKELYQKANGKAPAADAESMAEAVKQALDFAEPDDIILLSPGATSFGLFANEFDRGNKFKQAIRSY